MARTRRPDHRPPPRQSMGDALDEIIDKQRSVLPDRTEATDRAAEEELARMRRIIADAQAKQATHDDDPTEEASL